MILRTYVIALHEATFSIAVVCHPSFYEWSVSGVVHRFLMMKTSWLIKQFFPG
jgi:hypothetical protein